MTFERWTEIMKMDMSAFNLTRRQAVLHSLRSYRPGLFDAAGEAGLRPKDEAAVPEFLRWVEENWMTGLTHLG